MNISFDKHGVWIVPELILCNPNGEELHSMPHILNPKLTYRFTTFSELEFELPYEFMDDGKVTKVPYYNLVEQMRYIKIENIGMFSIDKPTEVIEGFIKKKTVHAKSIDSLFAYKSVFSLKGTYPMWSIDGRDSILKFFFEYFPDWSIGDVSVELLTTYRTYDISEQNWYDLLLNDVSESFDCVFVFDTLNKKISAYTTKDAITKTDIFVSPENIVKLVNLEPVSEEIQTGLEVHGNGGLDINLVNPLGTNTIYNFDYFKTTDWIHQDTIDALNVWEAKIKQYQPTYADNLRLLNTRNGELLTLNGQLYELNSQKKGLEEVLGARASDSQTQHDISGQKALVDAKQREIDAKQVEINAKNAQINNIKAILKNINDDLAWSKNFTNAQMNDINSIMKVRSYTNENFVKTSVMSDVDVQNEAQSLYDKALSVLDKVSKPRYQFTVEMVNFLALPEFETFTKQLQLGCEFTIGIDENTSFNPVLLEMVIDFNNPNNTTMTFSNSMRLSNQAFNVAELFNSVNKTTSDVSFGKNEWSDWVNNSRDSFVDFMQKPLDLAVKEIKSTTGQDYLQDQNGIRLRKRLPDGTLSPNQMWMRENGIVLTRDGFNSAAMAIGELTFNGVKLFGVSSELLCGNIIAGTNLLIKNQNNTVTIDANGISATNASLTLSRSDGNSKIYLNPSDGIKIQSMQGGSLKDVFYVDSSGNLNFRGNLTGASGNFSGNITGSSFVGGNINLGNGRFTVDNAGNCVANSLIANNATFGSCSLKDSTFTAGSIRGTSININDKFKVDSSGRCDATDLHISGDSTFQGNITGGSNINISSDINVGGRVVLRPETDCGIYVGSRALFTLSSYVGGTIFTDYDMNFRGRNIACDGIVTNTMSADRGVFFDYVQVDGERVATEDWCRGRFVSSSELRSYVKNVVVNKSSKLIKVFFGDGDSEEYDY